MCNIYSFLYMNVVNDSFTGAENEINCAYLRSYLKSKNIKTTQIIYDVSVNIPFIHEMTDRIKKDAENSTIVVYINEYNFYVSKTVCSSFRSKFKNKIICIGPGAACIKDSSEYDDLFDMFLEEHEYKKLAIQVYQNSDDYNIKELNEDPCAGNIPHPYSNGILPPEAAFTVGLYSSVGCFGKCVFCSYSPDNNILCYTIESIIDEILYIYIRCGWKKRVIYFRDDCFSISEDRIIKLCTKIIEMDIPYNFWCTSRADVLSEKALELLNRAKFSVSIGMETASCDLLESINKTNGEKADKYLLNIKQLIAYAKEIGLNFLITCMFFLPNENLQHVVQTLKFLEDNEVDNVSFNFMTLFYSSRIYNSYTDKQLTTCGAIPFRYRTSAKMYNVAALISLLKANRKFARFHYRTSKEKSELANYAGHITGINGQCTIGDNDYIDSLECCSIEDMIKHLEDKVSYKTKVFLSQSNLINSNEYFCDDRKNIRVKIPEYDSFIYALFCDDVYIENFSIILRLKDKIKFKASNYYEKKLKTINNINIGNNEFEKYIIDAYNKLTESYEYTVDDFHNFIFENSCILSGMCTINSKRRYRIVNGKILLCNFYPVKNSRECIKISEPKNEETNCTLISSDQKKKVRNIKTNCRYIEQVINLSAFIYKNFCELNDKFFVFSCFNYSEYFSINNLPENLCIILFKEVCYLYDHTNRKYSKFDMLIKEDILNIFIKQIPIASATHINELITVFLSEDEYSKSFIV